jgi:Na+/H+-dicarboxylate symporter
VLVLSVDWFIGMARALGNLIGNCVATVVIAAWEGDLDRAAQIMLARSTKWSWLKAWAMKVCG